MSKVEKIAEFLESELYDSELVEVWNDYCERNNLCGDEVFLMDNFDQYFENYTPSEIAMVLLTSPSFNPSETWFTFDGYRNIVTLNCLDDVIDVEAIAVFAIEHDYSFGIWEIADILEESESWKIIACENKL